MLLRLFLVFVLVSVAQGVRNCRSGRIDGEHVQLETVQCAEGQDTCQKTFWDEEKNGKRYIYATFGCHSNAACKQWNAVNKCGDVTEWAQTLDPDRVVHHASMCCDDSILKNGN